MQLDIIQMQAHFNPVEIDRIKYTSGHNVYLS